MSNPQVTIGVSAVDNAKAVLQSVDDKIKGTATTIDTTSTKIISKTSIMSAQVKQNFGQIATSAASLAAGLTSFAFSFGSIEKAQLSAQSAQLQYEKSLDRLSRLQASGKATSEQLTLAQQEVALNSAKLAEAQDNVSEAYTQFLAQIPAQVISFGHGFSGILQNISGKSIPQLISGLKTLNLTMISTFVTSPVGIAIVGVTSLIVILATNVGGLRDRIFELGAAILEFLDRHFKPLADAIRWFIDNVAKPLGNFFGGEAPPAIEATNQKLSQFNETVELGSGIVGTFDQSLSDLQITTKSTTEEFETFQDWLVRTENAVLRTTNENFNYLQSLGKIENLQDLTNDQINLAANYHRELAAETQRVTQENFNLIASFDERYALTLKTNEAIAEQAELIREAIELEKKYGEATRDLFDEFGRRRDGGRSSNRGGSNRVTVDDVKRHKGSLIDAIREKSGRSLDVGGTLFEDVFGFGMRTGTPHMLHEGERVIPRSRSSVGGGSGGSSRITIEIPLILNGKEVARAIAKDIEPEIGRARTMRMRLTHEAIHGIG